MDIPEVIKLKNIALEDISDVLAKIEKSFGFRFGKNELADTKTFGDLCDIISSRIDLELSDECTTQQVFYKIRQSLVNNQLLEKNAVTPYSELEGLFPKKGRKRNILQFEKELGFSLKILKPKNWITNTLLLVLLGSLVGLFINWKFGLIGITLSAICFWIANRFGKEFTVKTVGEVADKMARENYIKSRRNPKTVNRQEIVKKIKDLFSHDLDLDPSVLNREAPLF
jgi:hypothetical protein